MPSEALNESPGGRCVVIELPEELLDQILEEIAEDDDSATDTLLDLTLTCRAFLEPARRLLYRAPYASTSLRTRHRHALLCRTLFDQPDLFSYIRRFSSLGNRTEAMLRVRPFRIPPADEEFDPWFFQREIVRLGGNLRTVSIFLNPVDDTPPTVYAMMLAAADRPSLDYVSIVVNSADDRRLVREFCARLHALRPGSVRKLDLEIRSTAVTPPSPSAGLPIPVIAPRFRIRSGPASLTETMSVLPLRLDPLESLEFHLDWDGLEDDERVDEQCKRLLSRFSPRNSLRRLVYHGPCEEHDALDVEDYPFVVTGAALPPSLFTTFPHLTHLSLRGVSNLINTFLEMLSATSPHLRELDLANSYWLDLSFSDFPFIEGHTAAACRSKGVEVRYEELIRERYRSDDELSEREYGSAASSEEE
ncbi:hypothetical protein JCM10213v2_006899 [Rhodosporidiobolus nylandii]